MRSAKAKKKKIKVVVQGEAAVAASLPSIEALASVSKTPRQ